MQIIGEQVETLVLSLSFWNPGEKLESITKAGEGNMNAVYRVKTNQRSIILKRSFPYVQKFPQIPAPIERIDTEYQFLKLVSQNPHIQSYSPQVLNYFKEEHILILEDFGEGSDYSFLYKENNKLSPKEAKDLIKYLNYLHKIEAPNFPKNKGMRELNHEHIFNFPFNPENGFDLDQVLPGLQDLSISYKQDEALKSKVHSLGERYLSQGDTLLHGDYYPGSWLKSSQGTKVIDPEFGFYGDREFDLGIFMAHLIFGGNTAEEIQNIFKGYVHDYDVNLQKQYAGVELLRRLIGIAQLPLDFDLEKRKKLLEMGKSMILGG
ncbi:phosphotransferase [Algoriphagus namhaensis]|uniref:Phosphotransferase n=1 Tax=Algoriphagus namhaensis TaxID=915353 RepID=A0ABV8AVT3_9BACT